MKFKQNRVLLLFVFVVLFISGLYILFSNPNIMDMSSNRVKEITEPAGFINTEPIQIKDLVGKQVILIDFWTYSCINCHRTFPYLTAWHEKYKDKGLTILGIHTPEFGFEKKIKNVQDAVNKFRIKYPVVLDNDYGTWKAYQNRYWPAKYLIDINGEIVYKHFGEGRYEETEAKIQELLKQRMEKLEVQAIIEQAISSQIQAEKVDPLKPRSPEIYFGAWRNKHLANGPKFKKGLLDLEQEKKIDINELQLVGNWDLAEEYAKNTTSGSKILFKYQANKVFIVAESETAVDATIFLDRQPLLTKDAGKDIKYEQGVPKIKFQKPGLYRIIEHDEDNETHILEIIIYEPGVKFYAFTFG